MTTIKINFRNSESWSWIWTFIWIHEFKESFQVLEFSGTPFLNHILMTCCDLNVELKKIFNFRVWNTFKEIIRN